MTLANENRPRRFEDYIGQGNNDGGAIDYIKTVIKLNLHPSAVWITGPSGSGKTSLAQLYARATLCPNRGENSYEPCGECEVCLGHNTDNITHYVVRDATEVKSDFQDLIDLAGSTPHTISDRGDQLRRFILIDELQNASKQTISMLLDPLEFSPLTTTWVLVSMDPDKLDPIVREAIESRCKELNLRSLSNKEVAQKLSQTVDGLDGGAAESIAYFSSGNMRKAWSLLEYFLTMDEVENISSSRILREKGGGATDESRSTMWSYFYSGNREAVKSIIDNWCDNSDQNLIVDLLIEDLVKRDRLDDKDLSLIADIARWKSSKHRVNLSVLFMIHSREVEEISAPEIKVDVLPVKEDISPNLNALFMSEVKKVSKVAPNIYKMSRFTDIIEALR